MASTRSALDDLKRRYGISDDKGDEEEQKQSAASTGTQQPTQAAAASNNTSGALDDLKSRYNIPDTTTASNVNSKVQEMNDKYYTGTGNNTWVSSGSNDGWTSSTISDAKEALLATDDEGLSYAARLNHQLADLNYAESTLKAKEDELSRAEGVLEKILSDYKANPTEDLYKQYADAYGAYEQAFNAYSQAGTAYNDMHSQYKGLYDEYSALLTAYENRYGTEAERNARKAELEKQLEAAKSGKADIVAQTNRYMSETGGRAIAEMSEEERNAYYQQLQGAYEGVQALEREIDLIDYINLYSGEVYKDDTFWNQTKANYLLGWLTWDAGMARNDYLNDQTGANREYADALQALIENYTEQNKTVLDDEGAVMPWLSKTAAGYVPQFVNQLGAQIGGGLAGGLAGMAVGNPIAGARWGAAATSGLTSAAQMRGAAYNALIQVGVDEETAIAAANDEAFVSGLIEAIGTYVTFGAIGADDLLSAIGNAALKSNTKNAAVRMIANSFGRKAADIAARKAAKAAGASGLKKGVKMLGGALVDAVGEYVEEWTQEGVSIANSNRTGSGVVDLAKETAGVAWDAITGKNKDAREQMHEAGKEGFKIGIMFGGTASVTNNVVTQLANAKSQQEHNEMVDTIRTDPEVLTALIEEGEEAGEGTVSAKIAMEIEEKVKTGQEVTTKDVERLIAANDTYIKAEQEAEAKRAAEADKTIERVAREAVGAEIEPEVAESKPAGWAVKSAQQTKAEAMDLGKNGKQAFNEVAANVDDVETAALSFQAAYEAGRAKLPREQAFLANELQERAYIAGTQDADLLKNTIEESAGQAYTDSKRNGTEATYGTEVHLRNGSQWDGSAHPGGEVSAMAEGTGRNQSWKAKGKPADGGAASLAYGEKVSTASLGISGGLREATIQLVVSGDTVATTKAKQIAKERGLRLVLFAGDNLQIQQADGSMASVRAYISGDRVFVRADHPVYTSDQLMRHEAGHDMIAKGEINPNDVRKRIDKTFGKEKAGQLAENYVSAYEGTGLTAEEIWEEVICDSLGDMNIFANTASEATAGELLQETKKSAVEAKTEATRGPPAAEGKASRDLPVYETWENRTPIVATNFAEDKARRAAAAKKYGLDKTEAFRLELYVKGMLCYKLNERALDGVLNESERNIVAGIIGALHKFPEYSGTVYRNVKFTDEQRYNDFMEKHAGGKIVTLTALTSTSKLPNGYPHFGGGVVHMMIDIDRGCDIADTFGVPRQQEVILLPGTKLEVSEVTIANDGNPLIIAQEVAANENATAEEGRDTGKQRPERGVYHVGDRPGSSYRRNGENPAGVHGEARRDVRRDGVQAERGSGADAGDVPGKNTEKVTGKASRELDVNAAVNQSMTMQQAEQMVQRAFVLGGIKEWYEGEYRNGNEWLKAEGVDAVAMIIDNTWQLQEKYLNKIQGILDEEFFTTDILEAYLAGTLTGKPAQDNRPKRLDTSVGVSAQDGKFFAPRQIEDVKAAFETASKKVTSKNREEVYKARADVIMFAHTRGAAEALGLTQSELNKKLSTWARYTARARETSQRFNAGVADWNKWTGIENSNILTRATVSNEDLERLVGEITGDSDGWQRKYIVRTMLALDTHIDYTGLKFEFVGAPDHNRRSVNGMYLDSERKIRVKYNAPNTVAHEMGHFLDYQWARDIGVSGALTDGFGRGRLEDPDVKQWVGNFDNFKDSITDAADLSSDYTMDAKEVFARFVDKFVRWVNFTANGERDSKTFDRYDKFTAQHYVEFVRLLQEKSALDGKAQQAKFSRELDNAVTVYHGSNADFDTFDFSKLKDELGVFFAEGEAGAKQWGNAKRYTLAPKKTLVVRQGEEYRKLMMTGETDAEKRKRLVSEGYDTIRLVYNNPAGGETVDWVALTPDVIRRGLHTEDDNDRYSRELEEIEKMRRSNAELQEVNRELKAQLQTTEFAKVDKKALEKFTKNLLKDYESGADINETRGALDALYTYLANGDGEGVSWNTAHTMAYETATYILENASTLNDEMYQQYKDLRKRLKITGISIDKMYDHDLHGYESIAAFRKANFGRIKVSNDGTPVDVVYADLANTYPELFDESEYVTQPDQLSHIAEVLDSMQPFEENPYSHNMREAATWLASDIMERFFELPQAKPTFADKAERRLTEQVIKDTKKLERVRNEKNARIAKLIEEGRARVKETRQKERTKREEAVKQVKEHFKAKEAKASESRKARELRGKIMRHASDLSAKLLRPTDKQHIPQELQGAVAALLDSINLESNYTYDPDSGSYKKNGDGLPTKRTQAFARLRKLYAQLASEMVIDPDLLGEDGLLSDVMELGDKRIADMNSEELQIVWQTMRAVEASVSSYNKALAAKRWATVEEAANELRADNMGKKEKNEYGYGIEKLRKLTTLDMMTPETFFHILGNAGDGIFRMLRDAQDDHIRMMADIGKFTRETTKGLDVLKLEKETHTVTLGGESVQLTTAQLMELYVLNKREQAQAHIFMGGILPDVTKGKGIKKNAKAKPVRGVTMSEISAAVSLLSEEQIAVAKALQEFASTKLSEYGNKASMAVYGYEKFGEQFYWPIRVNRQEVNSDVQTETAMPTMANKGFTKGTKPHADNSVRLGSIFDTFASHASEMATYAAYLATMEDVNRIRNYTFRTEGQRVDSVRGIIDTVHGRQGSQYLSKLLQDLTSGVKATHAETPYTSGLMGNYKAASVGANLRVVIQQPTAILRAADMIAPQYLAVPGNPLNGWKKALQYAPIAQWKDWGYFDISTGRQMKNVLFDSDTALDKAKNLGMAPAGMMDSLSWGQLWNAVEAETKANRNDLQPGSEAFYKAVAARFTEIVDHTQVVDGILQRSHIMRNADSVSKMATAFMGEPTKQYNMVMAAIYDAKNSKSAEAKQRLVRTAVAVGVAGVVNAMAQSIIDAVRDDDKEKEYWEKWLASFKENVPDAFNPLGYVPYIKDVLSLVQGYDVARMDMESIADVISAMQNMSKAIRGEGKYTIGAASANMFATLAKLAGIPVANLKREIKTFAMLAAVESDNYLMQYRMEKVALNLNYSGNSGAFMDILYNAYKNDPEAYKIIYDDMIASGYDADSIGSKMESRMMADQGVTKVADLERRYLHPDQQTAYDSKMRKVQSSSLWSDATEEQRDKLEVNLYEMVTDSSTGEKLKAEALEGASAGLDEAEYLLWKLALDMHDADDNGSYTTREKADALISMTELSDQEKAFLWGTKTTSTEVFDAYDAGVDMDDYFAFKAALTEIEADKDASGKSISGSKKQKVSDYAKSLNLTDKEYRTLMEMAGYKMDVSP